MTGKITVGVIGCGYWGPNLLRNFAENESCELRWICDLDQQRLATLWTALSGGAAPRRTTSVARRLRHWTRRHCHAGMDSLFSLPREALAAASMCWSKSL